MASILRKRIEKFEPNWRERHAEIFSYGQIDKFSSYEE
jgi:hypothetical protein